MPTRRATSRPFVILAVLVAACGSPGPSAPAGTAVGPSIPPTAQPSIGAEPSPTPAEPTPAVTGLTGRVVFTRAGGKYGDETSFIADIDGSNERQLGELGKSGGPWATPDGSKVVVGGEQDGHFTPFIYDLDTASDPFIVPSTDGLQYGSGPLTPDGTLLVAETFTSPDFDFAGINVVTVATGKIRKLVDDRHYIVGDVSPDGTQVLLFLNNPDISPPAPGSLWVIGLDGKGLRQVTPPQMRVQCCMNYRWSPDGTKILFANPDGGLWTVGVDGSNPTEVFHQDGKWAITPTYSPDGSMILFALDPTANPFQHPTNELFVIRADGSGLTAVMGGSDFRREPIWLP